ncbi:hypothetical protein BH10BAC5_BH10BAC5_16550 [soil metagenome]
MLFLTSAAFAVVSPMESPADAPNSISGYSAKIKKGTVTLNWMISNPSNVSKFRLEYKMKGTEEYKLVDEIVFASYIKKETVDSTNLYSFSYKDIRDENGVYFYKLSVYDIRGAVLNSEELKLGISGISDFKLHQNNPNPFNPTTMITYELKSAGNVSLSIYNLSGMKVSQLINEYQNAGTYNVEFNANNFPDLSSGIYFYKLETSYSSDIKKMILAK